MIICIPKDDRPKHYIKNWRPISLLNTPYKIASACIAGRLRTVLPIIIDEDQKGFMKGRFIGENIRMFDVLVYAEKEQIPGLLLMRSGKGISWSFMQKALDFFNVGVGIKRWI